MRHPHYGGRPPQNQGPIWGKWIKVPASAKLLTTFPPSLADNAAKVAHRREPQFRLPGFRSTILIPSRTIFDLPLLPKGRLPEPLVNGLGKVQAGVHDPGPS